MKSAPKAEPGYFVPFSDAESEFTEKRSRFIGRVFRVETEDEVRARLEAVRKREYDARHNCWCYLLHTGGVVRCSDDGEPQGTAGQPMLAVFQREGVENALCVVTRYFGGVLLGAGGLTRAYARAAKDALDAAGKARMMLWTDWRAVCPYPLLEPLNRLLAARRGVVEESGYEAEVTLRFRLPEEEGAAFAAALQELSNGTLTAQACGERFLPGERETNSGL